VEAEDTALKFEHGADARKGEMKSVEQLEAARLVDKGEAERAVFARVKRERDEFQIQRGGGGTASKIDAPHRVGPALGWRAVAHEGRLSVL
jgi:hypothetical protein